MHFHPTPIVETGIFNAVPCRVLKEANYIALPVDTPSNYLKKEAYLGFGTQRKNAKTDRSDNREDKKSENKSILAASSRK